MEYTRLGKTDIKISKLCVGCMSFGKAGTMHDWTLDEKASEKIVKHALDLGINFLIRLTLTPQEQAKNTLVSQLKITLQEKRLLLHQKFTLTRVDCQKTQS